MAGIDEVSAVRVLAALPEPRGWFPEDAALAQETSSSLPASMDTGTHVHIPTHTWLKNKAKK